MKYRVTLFVSVFSILIGYQCRAYNPGDTTKAAKPRDITTAFTEPDVSPSNQWQKKQRIADTTLDNLQYYLPQYSLGNSGSAFVPLIFNAGYRPLGFYYGDNYLGPAAFFRFYIKVL